MSEPLHPLETVTTIYLLRHGHTEETEKGKLYNDPNVEITANGRAQAEALGTWLANNKPDLLLCSTAKRVRSTAQIIQQSVGMKAQPIDGFNEWSVGDWEGRTYVDLKEKEPDVYKTWSANPIENAPPGGESITDLYNRIHLNLKQVIKTHEGKQIGLVTHAGVIRCILVGALGMPLINFWRLSIPVGSVSKIDFSDNFATVHFTALQPTLLNAAAK
ncbi:MAG: histidine phosphatase family protein [Candidatus Obscuribacterales bacterium]|nr:histidine phosphatase family protein [Candidatus Obscuribacterales bacterium]